MKNFSHLHITSAFIALSLIVVSAAFLAPSAVRSAGVGPGIQLNGEFRRATVTQGVEDTTLLSFDLTGGAGDVTFEEIAFDLLASSSGTLLPGGTTGVEVENLIESCSLYDEGDVLLAGPDAPSSTGEQIVFTDDFVVAAGDARPITLKCDLTTGVIVSSMNVAAAVAVTADGDTLRNNNVASDIVASDANGNMVSVTVQAADDAALNGPGQNRRVLTVIPSGALAVTVDRTSPKRDILLAGQGNIPVATYRFTATHEDFLVTTLSLSEEQAEDDTGVIDSPAYANNVDSVTIEYKAEDQSWHTSTGFMADNVVTFSNLDFFIPAGEYRLLQVKVTVPAHESDIGGIATSNEKIRLGFSVDGTLDDQFAATGVSSGVALDDDDMPALGNDAFDGVATFLVRHTRPTLEVSSASPEGAALPGRAEVLRFHVSAEAEEDLSFSGLAFRIEATDKAAADWNVCDTDSMSAMMTSADFDLYNLTTDGTAQTLDDTNGGVWQVLNSKGEVCGTTYSGDIGYARFQLLVPEVVPAGSTYTFALYFDSSGASAVHNDTLVFGIPLDSRGTAWHTVLNASNEVNISPADTVISVDNGAAFSVGDVLVFDVADDGVSDSDERLLVVGVAANDLRVIRGYMGSLIADTYSIDVTDDIHRRPTSFLWQDDGTLGVLEPLKEYYGSHLLEELPLVGGKLKF